MSRNREALQGTLANCASSSRKTRDELAQFAREGEHGIDSPEAGSIPEQRTTYAKEFKLEAVRLAKSRRRPAGGCRELDAARQERDSVTSRRRTCSTASLWQRHLIRNGSPTTQACEFPLSLTPWQRVRITSKLASITAERRGDSPNQMNACTRWPRPC